MILSSKLRETKKNVHTNSLPNSHSTFKETGVMANTKEKMQSNRKASDLCSGDVAFKSRQRKITLKFFMGFLSTIN